MPLDSGSFPGLPVRSTAFPSTGVFGRTRRCGPDVPIPPIRARRHPSLGRGATTAMSSADTRFSVSRLLSARSLAMGSTTIRKLEKAHLRPWAAVIAAERPSTRTRGDVPPGRIADRPAPYTRSPTAARDRRPYRPTPHRPYRERLRFFVLHGHEPPSVVGANSRQRKVKPARAIRDACRAPCEPPPIFARRACRENGRNLTDPIGGVWRTHRGREARAGAYLPSLWLRRMVATMAS